MSEGENVIAQGERSIAVGGQATNNEIYSGDNRQIKIERDAISSAIISGSGNRIVIYQQYQTIQSEIKSSSETIEPNPYKGLLAFQEEDGDRYFGRKIQIEKLWNLLWTLHENTTRYETPLRLLPILGPSGSGKSSLARAGLIPELARRPLPGKTQGRVAVLVPGTHPLEALATVLARVATNDATPVCKTREFAEELKRISDAGTYDGLRRIADVLPEIAISPLIVLVDQFEEVYSLCNNATERQQFIENLICAASDLSARVSVVITLRSDFLGETQRHPALNQAIAQQNVIVPAMTVDELRQAIGEPAKQANHPLEDATIDLLIEQSRDREGALPLLQFALTSIWEGILEGRTSIETLRAIGGVGGALAGEAQRIYESLKSNEEKDIARRIFLGLIELGEGNRDTRRRTSVSSLVSNKDTLEQVKDILNRFSVPGVRLITLSNVDGDEIAEVTHEALFENWKLLNDWLDGQRSLIRKQRIIEEFAKQWNKKNHKGYLLQGKQLSDADKFRRECQKTIPLSKLANKYILKSIQRRWLDRCLLLSFLIVPVLIIETYFRERSIFQSYNKIANGSSVEKRQAVEFLTRGCGELKKLPSQINIFSESLFGNCRSLARQNGLSGVNLAGLDLEGVDLSQANLSNTEFRDSNLKNSNLKGTNLESANLTLSDLTGANLEGASLKKATLISANLYQTELFRVDFSNANLQEVNLQSANLRRAILTKVDLSSTYLVQINFEDTNLTEAKLSSSVLEEANLSNSNLSGADFSYSNLQRANLSNSNLSGADFSDSDLQRANFTDVSSDNDLNASQFIKINFSGSKMYNTNLHNADLTKSRGLTEEQLKLVQLCQTKLPAEIKINYNKNCFERNSN